jgi:hypothetical protein
MLLPMRCEEEHRFSYEEERRTLLTTFYRRLLTHYNTFLAFLVCPPYGQPITILTMNTSITVTILTLVMSVVRHKKE